LLVKYLFMPNQAVKIFISYAHEDTEYKIELVNHLSALTRQGIINSWHDGKILAGSKFDADILAALNDSNLIVFLLSSDFLASDYINNIEIKKALERETKGEVRILPILVRNCDFLSTPLAKYKILPEDAIAIKSWKDRDDAWTNVVFGIKDILSANEKIEFGNKQNSNQPNLNEPKEKKGCTFQIFISLSVIGVLLGFVYFFNNVSHDAGATKALPADDNSVAASVVDTAASVQMFDTASRVYEAASSKPPESGVKTKVLDVKDGKAK
jgi:TIR domain